MLSFFRKSLFILMVLPLFACAENDSPYRAGEHYAKLPSPVSTSVDEDKIEVVELFWYGCPHCYQLEPRIDEWLADLPRDVEFVRMPAVMGRNWDVHARAYYAAELLGIAEKTHAPLFDAIHAKRQRLFDLESLTEFYGAYGIEKTEFERAYNGFSVNSKIMKATNKQKAYRATGVPAIIVNGKYRVGMAMAAGEQELFAVVDHLIDKERKALQRR